MHPHGFIESLAKDCSGKGGGKKQAHFDSWQAQIGCMWHTGEILIGHFLGTPGRSNVDALNVFASLHNFYLAKTAAALCYQDKPTVV